MNNGTTPEAVTNNLLLSDVLTNVKIMNNQTDPEFAANNSTLSEVLTTGVVIANRTVPGVVANRLFLPQVLINLSIFLFVAVVNVLIIYVIARYRKLRTPSNMLMASISVFDILFSAAGVGIAYVIGQKRIFHNAYYLCGLILNSILCCQIINCLTLTAITIERFLAIRYPIWYKINYTKRMVFGSISLIWFYGFTYLILAVFVFNLKASWMSINEEDRQCTFLVAVDYTFFTYACAIPTNMLPVLVMIMVYIYIWKIVREREHKKRKRQYDTNQEHISRERKEVAVAKRFALIIGLFIICVMPLMVQNVLQEWTGYYSLIGRMICSIAQILHPAITPFLYIFGNKPIAIAIKRALCCKRATLQELTSN